MNDKKAYLKGVFYIMLSYLSWGVFPLYWKLLKNVSSLEILANRIFWSFVFMFVFCVVWKKKPLKPILRNKVLSLKLLICGCLMCVNWGVYIWAVNNNHIVDASLGYYINPLLNVILGVFFFKERLNTIQIIAIVLAFAGVCYFTFDYGRLPWVSLILGLSFSIYASIKKTIWVSSLQGLTIETLFVLPLAMIYLTFLFANNEHALFTLSPLTTFLLILGGVVTALPLFWFGIGANKVPLSTIGFMQYIVPTMQLLIGILVYKENFTNAHVVCFACIWGGLLLYSINMLYSLRKRKNNTDS